MRVVSEETKRTRVTESRAKVMRRIKSPPGPGDASRDLVGGILRSTLEAVQAEYGAVSLIRDENGSLEDYISHGLFLSQRAKNSVAHWVATHGQPLALETREEAQQVPDLVISHRQELPLLCVPIKVDGTTLGALQSCFPSVTRHEELLQKEHTLELSASAIGYIIENATLQHKLQETKKLLRQVNNISLEIQEAERERIILEIHDGIAQTLASALQYLQTLGNAGRSRFDWGKDLEQLLARAVSLTRQAIQEARGIISSATPARLNALGLADTVRQELRDFERETGCQVDLRLDAWHNLPRHIEFTIYRIIREAVNNVKKHAKSPRLEVELTQGKEWLLVRVKDWGVGFIPVRQERSSSNRSIGIFSMRRRAESLGGSLKISSSLGKGTEILVDIPLSAEEGENGENTNTNCRRSPGGP